MKYLVNIPIYFAGEFYEAGDTVNVEGKEPLQWFFDSMIKDGTAVVLSEPSPVAPQKKANA